MEQEKKGLVLEGGAMRGLFSAGVMDVLMENKVRFDGAVGVSAGAAFGVNYKSGQAGRVLRYNTRFCADPRYGGMGVFLRTGNLYSTDFCYGQVPLRHDPFDFDAYEKNPMEFFVVATDIATGRAVYHKYLGKEDEGFDWIRASASMPLVSRTVWIGGRGYLDGGIADSVPLKYFESIGYNRNLVVLTQPRGYQKKKNALMGLMKIRYWKYPELVKRIAHRHEEYNATLQQVEEQEREGKVLVIRPPAPLPVGRVEKDPERLKEAYRIGREEAERRLPEIVRFLGQKKEKEQ